MNALTLDLAYRGPETRLPASAPIHLKFYSHSGHRYGPADLKLLTHDCVGPAELDEEIDRLHRELEQLRKKGRRVFARNKRHRLTADRG